MNIKKGNTVKIIAGKDKSKSGELSSIMMNDVTKLNELILAQCDLILQKINAIN